MFARRILSTNERGDRSVDLIEVDVPRAPKRPCDAAYTEPYLCRMAKLRAIVALKGLNWTDKEIGRALDYDERSVRRKTRSIREYAEAAGRV